MSRLATTYRFLKGKMPSAGMLEQMRKWLFNMDSINGSVIVRQHLNGIDFQVNPSNATNLHTFKLWIRDHSGGYEYAICEQHPDTTGTPLAGRIIKPDGNPQTVAKVAWTAISATTEFWVKLEVNEGTVAVTIVTAAPTIDITADPAILSRPLGKITFTSGVPSILQTLQDDIDLEGKVIGAWYGNYAGTASEQILAHGKTGGLKWYLSAGTGARILDILDDDTLSVIAPATGTKHNLLVSHDDAWYFFTGTTNGGDEVVYFDGDDFKTLATSSSATEYLLRCDSSVIAWAEGDGACS